MNNQKLIWFLTPFLFILGCQNNPSVSSKPDYLGVEKLLQTESDSGNFSGSLVISQYDSVVFESYLGEANRAWDIPVSADTRFDIASLNKSFVAALILLAAEEQKLSLCDKLVDFIPFAYSGWFDSTITLHHLLTHTSGLPDYDSIDDSLKVHGYARFKRIHFSSADYVDFISNVPKKGEPGAQFYYSNFAYHLLSVILEEVYQMSFNEILQEKICRPLGMPNTLNYTNNEDIIPQLAEAYVFNTQEEKWTKNNFIDLTLGRRIFSTARDLQKWGAAMSDTRFLSAQSLKLIKQNHLLEINENISYGYGWVVYGPSEQFAIGDLGIDKPYIIHGGATEGYKAMLVVVNNGELIISLLANSGNRTNEMNLTKRIINQLLSKNEY